MTEDNKRRVIYCFIAILIALLAFALAQSAQDTADINNVFELVVNNTDLYPDQRTNHTVYWANESPIAVYIIFHSLGSGAAQAFDSNLTINGTVVLDRDLRTSAGGGFHDHWSFYTIVPKGANYSIQNSSNVFDIEWREYPILSGKNGTLTVNTSVSDAQLNLKVNKSGDTMTGQLVIDKMGVDGSAFSNGALFVRNNRSYFYANNESYTFAFGYNHSEFNAGHLVYLGASRNVANFGGVTSPDMQFSNSGGNPILVINGTTGNLTAYGNASFPSDRGIILKSPDGTKCGILTWTNADTLASTSITCP